MARSSLVPLLLASLVTTVGVGVHLAEADAAAAAAKAKAKTFRKASREPRLTLGFLGRYNSGIFGEAAAEIVAYDPATNRVFSTNGGAGTVTVIDISDPASPALVTTIDCSPYAGGGHPSSVAVHDGLLAIAVINDVKTDPGVVVFFDADETTFDTGTQRSVVEVGAVPDMVTFTPGGDYALCAIEGEPNDDYTVDPEGAVAIIDLRGGADAPMLATAAFTAFDAKKASLLQSGVRIYGPDTTQGEADGLAPVSRDLEPEYIACDDRTAWVTLQEANALAVVDIPSATVKEILPLGWKDHLVPQNALDPGDRDGPAAGRAFHMVNGPVLGMYQPDAIARFTVGGKTFLVMANEGDSRDYDGYSEEARLKDLDLDPAAFPDAANLQKDASFGRLKVTTALGDADRDGLHEEIYCYGGRSFSIRDTKGRLVWDSGSDLERITEGAFPRNFNATNDANDFDGRSDDKGPEPEGVAVGTIGSRTYAFIGLERIGGIAVYDVSRPKAPIFQTYVNTRDFTATVPGDAGPVGPAGTEVPGRDLGPEGMLFIPAEDSPNGRALLLVGHEVSGSTTIYQVTQQYE